MKINYNSDIDRSVNERLADAGIESFLYLVL